MIDAHALVKTRPAVMMKILSGASRIDFEWIGEVLGLYVDVISAGNKEIDLYFYIRSCVRCRNY